MKKITASTLVVAAAAALLSLASPASAGMLTLDDNNPVFTPEGAFSDNTIEADMTIGFGALIHLEGTTTITPDETNTASVAVTGTYSALTGDFFSVAYKFAADLGFDTPISYTLTADLDGVPITPISGTIESGLHTYQGTLQAPLSFPADDSGTFSGTLTFDFGTTGSAPLAAEPGTLDLTVQQIDFKLDPIPASITDPAMAQNISTRVNVGTGENVLIGGFIVTGNDAKQIVFRGIGPSLADATPPVMGALADPTLTLYDADGNVVATNDNWMDNSASDQQALADADLEPTDPNEAAIVATLDPGAYTAVVSGVGDTTGVALVEGYDLDNGATDSAFANISTRGAVGTGDNVMIGGITLGGGGGGLATVVVRGIGPSLADKDVNDALADPTLELFNANGDMIDSNDNWMDDPNMQEVDDAGLAPQDDNEAALYEILPAGQYTAILAGADGSTGVALVETYELDSPTASPAK